MKSGERKYLNGIGYVYYFTKESINPHKAAELIHALNVKSVRSWHNATWVLKDPGTLNREESDGFHNMYRLLFKAGVEQIIGLSHDWFLPLEDGTFSWGKSQVPRRDTAPGSKYIQFLDMYEGMWETLVKEFPEVTDWETGNEMNHKPFLKPLNEKNANDETGFTQEEMADICTDMMFRSARAIHKCNPDAGVIMPGMAPVGEREIGVFAENIAIEYNGMIHTLERIYRNIKSGEFGSKNPRHFFDALCWHPYYAEQDEKGDWHWKKPDETWIKLNREVYEVAERAGDHGLSCYLSEYGFNDYGDTENDKLLADYLSEGLRLVRECMPFVESVHVYRMFQALAGTDELDNYSIFDLRDGKIFPKYKAYAVQKQYGGTGLLFEDGSQDGTGGAYNELVGGGMYDG